MEKPGKDRPESVRDPDREAYDAMIREQKAHNARQAAGTADLAGNVASAANVGVSTVADLSHDAEDLRSAKAVAKFLGPVGEVFSAAAASQGFKADRAEGMPFDEAMIKHAGGFILSKPIGAAGAWSGGVLGALVGLPGGGAAVGWHMGQKDGEFLGRDLARLWGGAKTAWKNSQEFGKQVQSTVAHGVSQMSDPNWLHERTERR